MDAAAVRRQIDGCALFSALPDEERDALTRRTEPRTFAARELIFHQGDPADRVYLLASGQVRLSKLSAEGEQVIVAFITPGHLFAVVAGMQTTTYPVTAEAVVDSELLTWQREVVGPVMARHPQIALAAMQLVSTRMRELQERFRELATLPVPQRVARALLRLAAQSGQSGEHGVSLELRLTRQDLAELVGTTLYSVSRLLAEWTGEGIVDAGRARVTIVDRRRLEALAQLPRA